MWCPDIRGGVVIGSQGDGGFRRSMSDRGGVCWCFFGIRYIGDRVVGGGIVVIGCGVRVIGGVHDCVRGPLRGVMVNIGCGV